LTPIATSTGCLYMLWLAVLTIHKQKLPGMCYSSTLAVLAVIGSIEMNTLDYSNRRYDVVMSE